MPFRFRPNQPGTVRDMEECVFWKSFEPKAMIAQIHEILDNYDKYEPIRERRYLFAKKYLTPTQHAARMLESIQRVRPLNQSQRMKNTAIFKYIYASSPYVRTYTFLRLGMAEVAI